MTKPVLSIWQNRDTNHDRFRMVTEFTPNNINPSLRSWIDMVQMLGKITSG